MPKDYIIKFKFAGSGDYVWKKAYDTSIIHQAQENSFFKYSQSSLNDNKLDMNEMEKKYGKLIEGAVIWMKEGDKTKNGKCIHQIEYTIPGPQGRLLVKKGLSDTGEFSIKNNINKAYPVIKNKIEDCLKKSDCEKVYVLIKGHSRGGVASTIVLNKVAQEFDKKEKVEICSVTFDPVPGPKIVSDRKGPDSDKYNKIEINENVKGAVIYSINSGHSNGTFKPQKIYNYNVTIISEIIDEKKQGHSVGIRHAELDQKTGKYRKHHFKLGSNDYSPGELYKLETGLYWASQEFKLTKIDKNNAKEYISIILKKGENCRKNFLCHLIYNAIVKEEDIDKIIDNETKDIKTKLNEEKLLYIFNELESLFPSYEKVSNKFKQMKINIYKKLDNKKIKIDQKIKSIYELLSNKLSSDKSNHNYSKTRYAFNKLKNILDKKTNLELTLST